MKNIIFFALLFLSVQGFGQTITKYILDGGLTTLPSSPSDGDIVLFSADRSTATQNDTIKVGNTATQTLINTDTMVTYYEVVPGYQFALAFGSNKWYLTSIATNDVQPTAATYVSGTGTAGSDNTSGAILTRTLPGNTLVQNGDRIRIRAYYKATAGASITGTIAVNGVNVADLAASATDLQVVECWLHYIDNTHANIIENQAGALGNLSSVNASGFDFDSNQNITFSQNAVVAQHLVIYFISIDLFPKGVK